MNFYIADTHFGHDNIIRLSNRPFVNADEMDKALIFNWNKKVSNNDVVYIVGDFAFRSSRNPVEILEQLKGKKILIEGNHDSKNLKDYAFRKCFTEIKQMKTVFEGPERLVLCHYPIIEWEGYFRGSWLIYGHIHNNVSNNAFKCMSVENHALNAGVDITNFEPVTFEELKECNRLFKANQMV